MIQLKAYTRRRCFISYHHADEADVQSFIEEFDHDGDVFISRGIGASMPGDVIDSEDRDYIMRRVREEFLNTSTVTICMIGKCTWSRKFVDWEIAASLRNTANSRRNGLMAITLPSVTDYDDRQLPPRLKDNTDSGYANWWKYPTSTKGLADMIEEAFVARTEKADLATNSRLLFSYNRTCA